MPRRRIGFWYRLAVVLLKPPATLLTRRRWRGLEHVPPVGGVIVAANHHAYTDPVTVAHALYDTGRLPRFLAKAELFALPGVGRVLRGAGQIPVYRASADASAALADAVAALRRGELVVIYPEGTLTRDPQRWPMRGRTGVARLALASGAPVLPLAQWGAHRLYHPLAILRRHGRAQVDTLVGPPVDLSAFLGRPLTAEVLREATDAVMAEIRRLLGELRGQQPPAAVVDPARDPAEPRPSGGSARRSA